MSRTVTALYDTRVEAEAARDRLASEVDVEGRAKIIDKGSMGSGQQEQGSDFHRVPLSHEDRHAYGEGLQRGGYMLCAEVDDDADADRIVAILDQTPSVDMDERQDNWRNEGWKPYGAADTKADRGAVKEEHIPIVEEQLHVGKREVNRGGARVRSYVRETPVHEQVNLREEHVSVERRPVSGSAAAGRVGDDAFRDRNIEMTETAEVAMVDKEARVTEEVVLRKTAEERTENVQDTVRRTEVDVDDASHGERSAMGFDRDRRG